MQLNITYTIYPESIEIRAVIVIIESRVHNVSLLVYFHIHLQSSYFSNHTFYSSILVTAMKQTTVMQSLKLHLSGFATSHSVRMICAETLHGATTQCDISAQYHYVTGEIIEQVKHLRISST